MTYSTNGHHGRSGCVVTSDSNEAGDPQRKDRQDQSSDPRSYNSILNERSLGPNNNKYLGGQVTEIEDMAGPLLGHPTNQGHQLLRVVVAAIHAHQSTLF